MFAPIDRAARLGRKKLRYQRPRDLGFKNRKRKSAEFLFQVRADFKTENVSLGTRMF